MIPQIIIYKETSDARISNIIGDTSKPFSTSETNGEILTTNFNNFKLYNDLPETKKLAVVIQSCKKIVGNNNNNMLHTVLDLKIIDHTLTTSTSVVYDSNNIISSVSANRVGFTSNFYNSDTILYKTDNFNQSDSYIKAKDQKLTTNIPANVYNNTVIKDGLFDQYYYYFDFLTANTSGLLSINNDYILYRPDEISAFYAIYNYITNTPIVQNWKSLILNGIVTHKEDDNGILYKSEMLWLPELVKCMIISLNRSYKGDINSNQVNKRSIYDTLYQKYFILEHFIHHGNYLNCSTILESTRNYLSDFHNTEKWHTT